MGGEALQGAGTSLVVRFHQIRAGACCIHREREEGGGGGQVHTRAVAEGQHIGREAPTRGGLSPGCSPLCSPPHYWEGHQGRNPSTWLRPPLCSPTLVF